MVCLWSATIHRRFPPTKSGSHSRRIEAKAAGNCRTPKRLQALAAALELQRALFQDNSFRPARRTHARKHAVVFVDTQADDDAVFAGLGRRTIIGSVPSRPSGRY